MKKINFFSSAFIASAIFILSCSNPLGEKSSGDRGRAVTEPVAPISSISFDGISSITALSPVSIQLNWVSNPAATFYVVEEMSGATAVLVGTVLAPASMKVIAGLSVATTYQYRVRAADSNYVIETNNAVLSYTAPASIPHSISDISFWVDASQLSLADGASVSSWTDLSGLANHAVQPTPGFQPQFRSNQVNALPVLEFNGSTSYLDLMTALPLQRQTVCVVGKYLGSTNAPYLGAEANAEFFGYYGATFYYYQSSVASSLGRPIPTTNFELACTVARGAGSSLDIRFNGVSAQVTPSLNFGSAQFLHIGRRSAERLWGQIAEIVAYNRDLTSTEIATLESYLRGKYALP